MFGVGLGKKERVVRRSQGACPRQPGQCAWRRHEVPRGAWVVVVWRRVRGRKLRSRRPLTASTHSSTGCPPPPPRRAVLFFFLPSTQQQQGHQACLVRHLTFVSLWLIRRRVPYVIPCLFVCVFDCVRSFVSPHSLLTSRFSFFYTHTNACARLAGVTKRRDLRDDAPLLSHSPHRRSRVLLDKKIGL